MKLQLTSDILNKMRDWVLNCSWVEDADELENLTPAELLQGVNLHYAGGVIQFIQDCEY